MNLYLQSLSVEMLKMRKSLLPGLTFLGISLGPLFGGFFMMILKDPAKAKSMGLLSTKASLVGTADWPTFLSLLAQVIGVGGLILFGFVAAWVFGREFADRTVRNLLAVPTPRAAILAAKFTVTWGWCAVLTVWECLLGLTVGHVVEIPGYETMLILNGVGRIAVTAILTIALLTVVAWVASAGRGYLAALGFIFLSMFLAQIVAATGWGNWFPWSVAALYSGAGGLAAAAPGVESWAVVLATSLLGLAGTWSWWENTDHTR